MFEGNEMDHDEHSANTNIQQESGGGEQESIFRMQASFPPASVNSISVAQPPPSFFSQNDITTPTTSLESSLSSNELQELKASMEYTSKVVQRQLQELKNTSRLEQQRYEKTASEINALKQSVTKAESKLGPLQKVLAAHTDKARTLKKEMTDSESTLKTLLAELRQQVSEIQSQIEDIKQKLNELTRKVNEGRSSSGSNNSNISESLMQILEPYERQLGMYDVRIAELDARFQVLESTSYSGTLLWKIPQYARRKAEAISGKTLSLYSQPFYTSRYGYKMCARIYLNGDGMGKGTHMSLFFVVMKGEYDALLPWPFRQKVTLMLLDQGVDRRHLSDTFRPDPTSSSFKLPTTDMNIASGCPLFVAHNVINDSTYIKGDTIFLRILVDTSDLDNL